MYEIIILKNIFIIVTLLLTSFTIIFYKRRVRNICKYYKYKINNFFFTTAIALLYIFIILFYYIRLFNLGQQLDLKILLYNIILIWNTLITPLSLFTKISLIIFIFIFFTNISILFISLIKKATLEIFKLYIFILKHIEDHDKYIYKATSIKRICLSIKDNDLISYNIYKILYILQKKISNEYVINFINEINKILIYSKTYKLIINLLPLLVFIYDCIYNHFIIIHFYYYLLFFVPLMLIKRITKAIGTTNDCFAEILWNIYYLKNDNIIYVVSEEQRKIFNILFDSNISYIQEFLLDMVEFHLKYSITYIKNGDVYYNNDNICLIFKDNKIFEYIEDDFGNPIIAEESKNYSLLIQPNNK